MKVWFASLPKLALARHHLSVRRNLRICTYCTSTCPQCPINGYCRP